ncbi:hypothetical protein AAU61_10050 [Desulfocarbo indianensis]|nr:hypothetical protein AAU61_10050 [Desulfocarbo indianensis]
MAQASQTTLSGRVTRITFQNPENGYTVAKLQPAGKGAPVAVVGRLPGVVEGQELSVTGREVLHPKFGVQVEVESFEVRQPSDDEGVRRYLASGLIKGVGPKLAEALVSHLGPEAIEIILESPKRLAEVPGIGRKRAKLIAEAVRSHGALRELMVFLQGHGVPASTALRIHRRYGAGALGVVRENPHQLAADIQGIGFATADQIAAKLGISHDHPGRLQAGLEYTLAKALDEGHVYLPYEELIQSAANLLGVERGLLGPAFASLHVKERVTVEDDGDLRAVYLTPMFILERRAAKGLSRLRGQKGLLSPERAVKAAEWVAGQLAVAPSAAQGRALQTLLTNGLAVLTGGPGTGKTTLIRALITIARRMGQSVALAAPTGRAAKRLSESTGLPAATLHRLLEYAPRENAFQRHEARPLDADLIVVDECSMVDVWLAAHLFEAVGQGSRLILVGDADQLPSVGAGLVLRQVIDSGVVPVAALKEIFRQDAAGLIVRNAHRILAGQLPLLPEPGQEADFFFIEEPDPEKAADVVRRLVCERLPARFGLDPVREVQVLAPMHRGSLGCQHLNQLLRGELNPHAGRSPSLASGDKVMQIRNNYDLEAFNGDLGLVSATSEDGALVAMGEREVTYSLPEMDDLTLAYAVTIHKSQGSEYPAVVIALGMEHYIMLNRPLLYTAVTRGQKVVVIVGHAGALKRAVERNEPTKRYARLDKRLKG